MLTNPYGKLSGEKTHKKSTHTHMKPIPIQLLNLLCHFEQTERILVVGVPAPSQYLNAHRKKKEKGERKKYNTKKPTHDPFVRNLSGTYTVNWLMVSTDAHPTGDINKNKISAFLEPTPCMQAVKNLQCLLSSTAYFHAVCKCYCLRVKSIHT